MRTSTIGILANIMLSAFKVVVGFAANSIVIVLDAVNNTTDALSSVITLIGTKMANKAPDREHPYGHGRLEYLAAMAISVLVLYAGTASLVESVKKAINPKEPHYTYVTIIVVCVAIIMKLWLSVFFQRTGKSVNSGALINSGKDALLDVLISVSTLIAAIVFMNFGLSLEAWLGIAISLIIIKSGLGMFTKTASQILGERATPQLARSIMSTICKNQNVLGAYDLILNNYGPDEYTGSVHIEVPGNMTATEIDALSRQISRQVMKQHNVHLSTIGIYTSSASKDPKAIAVKEIVNNVIKANPSVLQMHGFYYNESENRLNFDIIIDYANEDKDSIYNEVYNGVKAKLPDIKLHITDDIDLEY